MSYRPPAPGLRREAAGGCFFNTATKVREDVTFASERFLLDAPLKYKSDENARPLHGTYSLIQDLGSDRINLRLYETEQVQKDIVHEQKTRGHNRPFRH